MGIGESYCSEGAVGAEILPGVPGINLMVLLASALGAGKMSTGLQKSRSSSLCSFQYVCGCVGALRVLNISYL